MSRTRTIALLLVAGVAAACGGDAVTGPSGAGTRVLLTDGPFPYEQVGSVNVYIVSIAASTTADTGAGASGTWTTIVEPHKRVNLLDLQNGKTTLLGEGAIPAGEYQSVQMVINTDSSSITHPDGTPASVDWQQTGLVTLNALVEEPVTVPSSGASVVIDFDVGRSFVPQSLGGMEGAEFTFIPWIRAVNEAGTGAITGVITAATEPGAAVTDTTKVPGVSITVYRSNCPLRAEVVCAAGPVQVATALTDSLGRFTVKYLQPGTYGVALEAPAVWNVMRGYRYPISVAAGQTASVNETLTPPMPHLVVSGPNVVAPDSDVAVFAQVFDANGDSVIGAPITWRSDSAQYATVSGSGSTATVHGVTPGIAAIVATSGTLADSLWLTVAVRSDSDTTSGGGGAPVASVVITPASQTVQVGDSVGVFANLYDSLGNALYGRSVTWSLSDSSLVVFYPYGQSALLFPQQTGTLTLTAKSEGKSGTASVTIH